jgi:hypothetical protein
MGQATVLMVFPIFCFVVGVWGQAFKVESESADIGKLPGWV